MQEQDRSGRPWRRLLELIDVAAADGREVFAPAQDLGPEDWSQIITLPRSISKLRCVKHLQLYGSNLERIPPEIGELEALERFTPYTSYNLHWFPYEITRCRKLVDSTVSTRALYGNRTNRLPFPKLPIHSKEILPDACSICRGPFGSQGPITALGVAPGGHGRPSLAGPRLPSVLSQEAAEDRRPQISTSPWKPLAPRRFKSEVRWSAPRMRTPLDE